MRNFTKLEKHLLTPQGGALNKVTPSAARLRERARGTALLYRAPAKILRSKRFVGRG